MFTLCKGIIMTKRKCVCVYVYICTLLNEKVNNSRFSGIPITFVKCHLPIKDIIKTVTHLHGESLSRAAYHLVSSFLSVSCSSLFYLSNNLWQSLFLSHIYFMSHSHFYLVQIESDAAYRLDLLISCSCNLLQLIWKIPD